MKTKFAVETFFVIAFCAAIALQCGCSRVETADSTEDELTATNETVNVDFDFPRMNPTMRMTYTYRLVANPREFEGMTLRISGTLLTRVDNEDGKRYFGCLMGEPGGCACCSPGGVLEFTPKDSYVLLTNFPPVESQITVTGTLKMFELGDNEMRQAVYAIPRLVDADIFWSR